jgi:hypothetical protein
LPEFLQPLKEASQPLHGFRQPLRGLHPPLRGANQPLPDANQSLSDAYQSLQEAQNQHFVPNLPQNAGFHPFLNFYGLTAKTTNKQQHIKDHEKLLAPRR